MSPTQALTRGVHHIGLTVRDVERSRAFFIDALGFTQIGADQSYPAVFLSDGSGVVTLWQAENPGMARSFDRKANIGLHHLALAVADAAALDAVFASAIAWPGVEKEFAPGPTRPESSALHAIVRLPDGIRVEFFALA